MRRYNYLFAAAVIGCIDVGVPLDSIPSTGAVKVPTTIDAETHYRDMDALQTINKNFKPDEVEKHVMDLKIDLPSRARLLSEFKCFGTWRRQNDFYLNVLKKSPCAHLRHKAVQLLDGDLCNPATVDAFLEEYKKSVYPSIQQEILRRIGKSGDKRATALLEVASKSKSKLLSSAAAEGKALAAGQKCQLQPKDAKPGYGITDIADVCEPLPEAHSGE